MGVKACNYPVQPDPNFVMAHMNIGGWIFEKIDSNSTKLTSFADLDLRGNIPDFVKNLVSEKRIQGLKDLEDILKQEGYWLFDIKFNLSIISWNQAVIISIYLLDDLTIDTFNSMTNICWQIKNVNIKLQSQ